MQMNTPDDPPIREFADRGILWLLESPQNLADLLRLLSTELAAQLDFTRVQRINRSFVPPNLHKQEADMLVRIPFREPTLPRLETLVYILVEHQSEPDEIMGLRLLSYLVQVWEKPSRHAVKRFGRLGGWLGVARPAKHGSLAGNAFRSVGIGSRILGKPAGRSAGGVAQGDAVFTAVDCT